MLKPSRDDRYGSTASVERSRHVGFTPDFGRMVATQELTLRARNGHSKKDGYMPSSEIQGDDQSGCVSSGRPSDQRYSIAMVRPSIQPSSCSRCTKAAVHALQPGASEPRTPIVGNNRYQTAGLEIGTRSRLDAGQLWVCTAPRTNRQNFARIALSTLVGRATDQELNAFEVNEIWVQPGTPRVNVSTDGEVSVMDAPLHYRVRPQALRVIVPVQRMRPGS